MTIYEVLKADHQRMRALLERIDTLEVTEEASRLAAFQELQVLLRSHAQAEAQVFYAALEVDPRTAEAGRQGQVEHEMLARLVERLESLDTAERQWVATFAVLRAQLEHHIQEEETEIFPQARRVIPQSQEQEMAERLVEEEERAVPVA